jgi:hypothetical protein
MLLAITLCYRQHGEIQSRASLYVWPRQRSQIVVLAMTAPYRHLFIAQLKLPIDIDFGPEHSLPGSFCGRTERDCIQEVALVCRRSEGWRQGAAFLAFRLPHAGQNAGWLQAFVMPSH